MARTKRTLTKEAQLKANAKAQSARNRAKQAEKWAKKATEDWKLVIKHKLKPRSMQGDGKAPCKQLVAKPARKNASAKVPKPRTHCAIIAMCEIRRFQKSINLLILLLPFSRLIHGITQDFKMNLRFQSRAILALEEAAQSWLVGLFESANLCAIHRGCQTIAPKDFQLVKSIHHIAGINMWWK